MYNYRVENVKKINQTIKYPVVLFTFFFVILILINQFVLLSFTNFFLADSDSAKSVIYSIMIIDILSNIFIILTVVVVISGIIFKIFYKKLNIEEILRISQKISLYKNLLKLQTSYYLSLQMSMLLITGLLLKYIHTHFSKHIENFNNISYA